ncbi:putative ribonuclease H-like domain-containing protein [Tanacetum coccineum]
MLKNLAILTTPSTSSTNDVFNDNLAYEVGTVYAYYFTLLFNTACPQVSTANFSDNIVYAFMVENPNGSNLLQQDLEQIHEDDLEAMDLKWQLSLLRNVEHQETKRASSNIKTTLGSDMDEEQVQTNMALMAFLDSEVYNDKNCTKTCLKNYETLKKQCDDLIVKLNQTEFTTTTYKRGLTTVEEQLITYRKNEVLFSEEVAVLKREVACKDYEINVLKSEFEKVKQEKEGIEFKIEKFYKASKDLDKLLGNDSKDNSDDSLVKEQVSKDTSSFVESSLNVDKETVFPVDKKVEVVKPKNHEKPVKKLVSYVEMYRSQTPRGNQRNGNGQKSNQLGRKEATNKMIHDLLTVDAQATLDESMLWHRRLGHINFKNINKLVKDNLVRGLPIKHFENDQTCVACLLQRGSITKILDVDNGEPKSATDDQKKVEDGLDNKNDEKYKFDDDSSPKEVNAAGQHVNTASPDVNTGSFKLNVVSPSVNSASSYDRDSPKDMFTMGASHTLEATHVKFFSDKDEPEVDLGEYHKFLYSSNYS